MDSSGDDFFDSPRERSVDAGYGSKDANVSSKYSSAQSGANNGSTTPANEQLRLSDNDMEKGYNNNNISALRYQDIPPPEDSHRNMHHHSDHQSFHHHSDSSSDHNSVSSRSSGSSKHASASGRKFYHSPHRDEFHSEGDDDHQARIESPTIKVDVNKSEQRRVYDDECDRPKSRRYISKDKSKERKPPLPSSRRGISRNPQKDSMPEEESLNLLEPGSTYYTSDGRKMRRGRCSYSDKEISGSDSSSDEELSRRRSPDRDELKLGLAGLASPRSRSRSNSSEWSTGSESFRKRAADVVDRPRTRLSRRSDSPNSGRRQRRSSSSSSSITVSSLSDAEAPDSRSQDIFSKSQDSCKDAADRDRMNLEALLSALLNADGETPPRKNVSISIPNGHQDQSSPSKSNFTHSRDRMRSIDSENQRLLNSIVAQRTNHAQTSKSPAQESKGKGQRRRVSPPRRVTNATVNRQREQQRIERENLALLKRLNKIKPSADIRRDQHLVDYRRQMSYHCPDLRDSEHQLTANRSKSSLSVTGGRRPASASYSRGSYGDSSKSSRPSSAINRPSSAINRPSSAINSPVSASSRRPASAGRSATIKKKPEWQMGW